MEMIEAYIRIRSTPGMISNALKHFDASISHAVDDRNQKSGYRLAGTRERDGDVPLHPYHIFPFSLSKLDEFGIGISLYFRSLLVRSFIIFCCAFILIASIRQNEQYNPSPMHIYFLKNPNGTFGSDVRLIAIKGSTCGATTSSK